MANLPTDVAAQALDAIGSEYVIGDLEEGSREAQVLLRAYLQCLQQLLRGANWDFARKTAPLQLLADATGQTPDVGVLVPSNYVYEYAYPPDCMRVRFVPWNHQWPGSGTPQGNYAIPSNVPIESGLGAPWFGQRIIPARFVIATDGNYPPPSGVITWETQGLSPQSRTVILTNVKNAQCTYTALMLYPSLWDPLFREALVAYLASQVALPLTKDKALGRVLRDEQIQIAKQKLEFARQMDGNEAFTSSDIPVDWMNARYNGGGWGGYGGAFDGGLGWGGYGGGYGGGWDACSFSDGSAY